LAKTRTHAVALDPHLMAGRLAGLLALSSAATYTIADAPVSRAPTVVAGERVLRLLLRIHPHDVPARQRNS